MGILHVWFIITEYACSGILLNMTIVIWHIILNNDYWRVVGNRYESIQGKFDIFSSRGYFHKTEGTIEFDAAGAVSVNTPTDTFSVNANDIILDAGAGALIMKAKSFSRQVQTSEHTDSVACNSTLKVSG